jgi:hypothetical protein
MMEQLTCPDCGFTSWTVWGEPFESHGTLVILTAECNTGNCGHKLNIGVVDGKEMVAIPKTT